MVLESVVVLLVVGVVDHPQVYLGTYLRRHQLSLRRYLKDVDLRRCLVGVRNCYRRREVGVDLHRLPLVHFLGHGLAQRVNRI